MLLTKKQLNQYLISRRINIPQELEKHILKKYGKQLIDNDDHVYEYTEQDIHEQVRKIVQNYKEKEDSEVDF